MKPCFIFTILLATSVPALGGADLKEKIIGDWCLNTEEYDGDVSVDGSKWSFRIDGTYMYKQAYVSTDSYSIEGDTIALKGFGKMKVLFISDSEMNGKIYSNYHFTKNKCLPIVKEAFKITELNNSIIEKNFKRVKEIIEEGIDINKPDTRSSQKSTPLMVAIKYGDINTIKYILSFNPDLGIINAFGRTALDVAEISGNKEVIGLIKSAL